MLNQIREIFYYIIKKDIIEIDYQSIDCNDYNLLEKSCLDKNNQDIKEVILVINDSKKYEDLDSLDYLLFKDYSSSLSSTFSKYIMSI